MVDGAVGEKTGRRAANLARLKQRLLDAVERCLDDDVETYTQLSIERLLEESGVARSTFYYHFEDKNSLIAALAEDALDEFEVAAMAWWEVEPTRESLQAANEQMFEVYWEHRVVLRSIVESAAGDSSLRARYERIWENLAREVIARIESAQRENRMRRVDPAPTGTWLVWMTERGLYQVIGTTSKRKRKRLASAYTDIVWMTLFGG